MQIVLWQTVLTDHQSYTLQALQNLIGKPLKIISGVRSLPERRAQGWQEPYIGNMTVHYLPTKGWWHDGLKILQAHSDAVHLFNGFWGDRRFFLLLLEAQRRRIKTGLITEPYSEFPAGYLSEESILKSHIKAYMRPLIYQLGGWLAAKKLCAVFAISEKAINQFSSIGVKREALFPFGYFVPKTKGITKYSSPKTHKLRLIFVGSIIKRKGLETLIKAVNICNRNGIKVQLDIYGPGNSTQFNGINYKGIIPFGEAQQVIAGYDLLTLPSLYDGWGVVVNEALLQKIPVLVSDKAGAKILVQKSGAGKVIESDNVEAWSTGLKSLIKAPKQIQEWRDAANLFHPKLTPEAAAHYLYESLICIKKKLTNKPDNPWYL